jgi:heavy metal sensor kinase
MSSEKLPRSGYTLAFRLTLWYAGIFTVSSCIAFFLFYTLITSVMRERTDQELSGQVSRFSALLTNEGLEAVVNGVLIEAQAAGVKKVFFRLLQLNGHIYSSSNVLYWKDIGIDKAAIRELLGGKPAVFDTIVIPGRPDKIRILYAMLSPTIIVQVGQAMESYSRFLDAFKGIFIATMSFLILVAAGVGWFMAKRAVSGVEAVTRTARKISGGTLKERVPVEGGGDEIDQLAITFNEMLDRIQVLLSEIREMGDNIAHDLKSPITRIRGEAEVTLTTGNSLTEYKNMAASTIEESDRLLDMINTMLMISKTEAGLSNPSCEEIDISDIVGRACELFEPMAEDKGIVLSYQAPEKSLIAGDSRMIQRMLSNVLDNAVKYTPTGGSVDVAVMDNGTRGVTVSVKDTGTGISGSDLPRIFERFYRCDQSRSQPGTGLGLSLARAVARAHGGDIDVVSSPGQGSTFTITLPKSIPSSPVS